ncbi:hypothetical protein [Pontivivens insulae]|uniref:Uncharacterized protein n=1 Tax=Pontivivens insulae TaxID=1639689 RepID=A0A2R8ACM5_9RHOB|nr:hypothetical protein [Pontivivens insulae]RED13913.1 hypothetical protein DFR53_1261 [Pontivivens insulae]SPF29987.1 hypothetical protein POI8812_02314 [Pontivivens insulae]
MKVSFKPSTEKSGLIFKKEVHVVRVTVQMSEEEIAAAQAAGFMKQELFDVPFTHHADTAVTITVADLAKGFDMKAYFVDFIDASGFTNQVKEMLIRLKNVLEAKMSEGEEEFEL